MLNEIGGGAAAFTQVTGRRTVPFFRPPYGKSDAQVLRAAGEKGYTHVFLWNVDVQDWRASRRPRSRTTCCANVGPGSIVIFHLSALHTAEALPTIISTLRARGYDLVTLSGLLKGDRRFFDVPEGTEASRDIDRLVDEGIVSGYSDDWFGPYDSMTRAQFAKVAMLASGLHTEAVDNIDNPTFTDVPLVARSDDGDAAGLPLRLRRGGRRRPTGVGLHGRVGSQAVPARRHDHPGSARHHHRAHGTVAPGLPGGAAGTRPAGLSRRS